ncbi:unnamed protein product [Rangifer tarandus platyrhynchus]|uniref:Uncharacterized protein n=1 Tax=Rangifer tarandus platyrhynchus TaxID=3082113 RepID=A0AC59Y066_RANTA
MFCVIKSKGIFRSLSQIPDSFICSLGISTGMSKTELTLLPSAPKHFSFPHFEGYLPPSPIQAQKPSDTLIPPLSHGPGLIHYLIPSLPSTPTESQVYPNFSTIFFKIFLTIFLRIRYNIASVLCFVFLAVRPLGPQIPDQPRIEQHPQHWKVKCQPLDC